MGFFLGLFWAGFSLLFIFLFFSNYLPFSPSWYRDGWMGIGLERFDVPCYRYQLALCSIHLCGVFILGYQRGRALLYDSLL